MLGNAGRVVKSFSSAGEITQLDPPSVKLSYPASPTGNGLFHLLFLFTQARGSQGELGGLGLGVVRKDKKIRKAATFGSEEVCADPLLGLTHLGGLGGGLPLVRLTIVNCLSVVNEHQKVHLSL